MTARYFPPPQVILLTCEQPLNPVEVELVFQPSPSAKDPDTYTVTCRTASNHLVRTPEQVMMAYILTYCINHLNVSAGVRGAH